MFFLILGILIFLLIFIYQAKINVISKKIISAYSLWVFIILAFSTFNLFGLYGVNDKVYITWIVNAVIFIGIVLIFSKKNMIKEEELDNKIVKRIENSKVLFYVGIIVMLLLAMYKIRYDNVTENLALEYVRMARFDRLFANGVESIFFDYILKGTLKILLICTSILIVKRKFKNKICIVTIISLFLYTMIGYGRMTIFEFIIYIIISYLFLNDNLREKINIKKVVICILGLMLLLIIGGIIVVIRLQGKEQLSIENIFQYGILEQIKQIVVYFNGGFRTLDIFMKEGFSALDGITLGRLSFAGIEDIIGLILNNLGYKFATINSLVGPITQTNVQVGEQIYMNAFYTCIMNYFGDFGYVGVIIFPILHGLLVSYCINNYIKRRDLPSIILSYFVIMNTFCSIYRWNYQFGQTIFLLVMLMFWNFVTKKKVINGDVDDKEDSEMDEKKIFENEKESYYQ